MIAEGCKALTGMALSSFTLVFVESKRPHCIDIVTLKDNDLALGHRANKVALHKFMRGLRTGEWPGPFGEAQDARFVEMAEWDRKSLESELEFEESLIAEQQAAAVQTTKKAVRR